MMRKSYRPHAHSVRDRKNYNSFFDLTQECLERGLHCDAAFLLQRGDLKESYARNAQAVAAATRFFNRGLGPFRNFYLPKRQPKHNVRVEQDHFRFPHSLSERAGETTSP